MGHHWKTYEMVGEAAQRYIEATAANQSDGEPNMIKGCTKCGGLYVTESGESFAGAPCSCVTPSQYVFLPMVLPLAAAGAQEWGSAAPIRVPVAEAPRECLGCIASNAGVGRCLIHGTKPSTVTTSEVVREAARALYDACLLRDDVVMGPGFVRERLHYPEQVAAIISKHLSDVGEGTGIAVDGLVSAYVQVVNQNYRLTGAVERLQRALKIRDTFITGDEAATGLSEIARFLDPHFTGREGRAMTWREIIERITAIDEEKDDTRAESERLESELTRPKCNECGVALGDNWCADCAGHADRERLIDAHANAIREAVEKIDAMRGGYTIDIASEKLVSDPDGPWFVKADTITALRSLLDKPVTESGVEVERGQ